MVTLPNPCIWFNSKVAREYVKHLYDAREEIEKVLPILDTMDWDSEGEFLEPRSEICVNLIHLAAYSGRLEVLNLADTLGVNFFVQDKIGRTPLHYAVIRGHVGIVEWLVNHRDAFEELPHEDIHGLTALHMAVLTKSVDAVRILVDTKVDWIMPNRHEWTPLDLAYWIVKRRTAEHLATYEKIVEILLSSQVFKKLSILEGSVWMRSSTIPVLIGAVSLNSVKATNELLARAFDDPPVNKPTHGIVTPMHIAARNGSYQILRTLLAYKNLTSWMINFRDQNENTPLHVAVMRGQLECAKILWGNNAGNLLSEGYKRLTVINMLCRYNEHPTKFLTDLLDAGIGMPYDHGNILSLDFEMLAPPGRRQMDVVSALIRDGPSMERANILHHPLVEAFLGLKWERFRYSYIILMVFQVIFIACLLWYATFLSENECNSPTPRWVLLFCACVILCHNGLQLVMIPKYYVKQYDTWLSIICGILSFVVGVAGESCPDLIEAPHSGDPHQLPHRGQPSSWVLQCTSIAILFAWIQVMLLVGRIPTCGYYALMFSTVLKNVSKVFVAVVWIVVGFSLSFWILFHDKDQFDNPAKAFVKTVVMMMGEYEYSDLFTTVDNDTTVVNSTFDDGRNTLLPITSRIVFLGFVMLASVVLMNLMIGMAVTDIQGLHNEGLILRLIKQAEFVSHLEQVTSHWIFRGCWVPRCLKWFLEFQNSMNTKLYVPVSPGHWKPLGSIPRELVKKLFELAPKDQRLHERDVASTSVHENEESLIEVILSVEETLKKVRQKLMQVEGRESSKTQVNGRNQSQSDQDDTRESTSGFEMEPLSKREGVKVGIRESFV